MVLTTWLLTSLLLLPDISAQAVEQVLHGQVPAAASPPRGALPLLFYYGLFIHVNTPFIIGVSTTFLLNSVS